MKLRGELIFIKQFGFRILGLLLIWMVCRIGFYLFNADYFPVGGIWNSIKLLFFGLRFDLAAIAYVNALLALTYILPFSFRKNTRYRQFQKWIFLIFNGLVLLAEVGDMGYFQFSFRRAIGTDLNLVGETANMAGQFVYDFWYFLVVYVLMLFLLNYIYKKTTLAYPTFKQNWKIQTIIFPLAIGGLIIAMRGGLQLRPIMSLTTAKYVDNMRLMPLQTNTTLNLFFSVQQNLVQEKKYMSEAAQGELINIYKNPSPKDPFKKENVFIIVLESFGKEHVGFFNDYEKSSTPFLDSLMLESWYFENAFAAEMRSTQGIAAITASLPALMENAFMFSPYQGNRISGIAEHLEKKGYTSGFFHGSNPGSMEFEKFSKLIGFQNFYDRTAYPDQNDYDGNWGIWDDPFFQFTLEKVNEYQDPFVTLLFSLTSHHPYYVEDFFEKKHPDESPVFRAIRYTDYALRNFFETAKKMDWYENTLFVITADHIGRATNKRYSTNVGKYKIPMLFFKPNSDLKGKDSRVVQQTDILPTVLDYLNYDEPYFSFGVSAFEKLNGRFAYMHSGGFYQVINDSLMLSFNQRDIVGVYNYKKDEMLTNDIKGQNPKMEGILSEQIKAAIQIHHQAMIRNKLVIDFPTLAPDGHYQFGQ